MLKTWCLSGLVLGICNILGLMHCALMAQVDIYSFGVIMWEVVSHEQPARGRMRSLKVPQECPADIDQLISSCLSDNPEERPTAKEAFHKLKAWKDRHTSRVTQLLKDNRQKRLRSSGDSEQLRQDSGDSEPRKQDSEDSLGMPRC